MKNVNISRTFAHKTFGKIGAVELNADYEFIVIDGETLPESSVRALVNHGLQLLQDSYAGAKTADAARKSFNDKLAKLLEGKLGMRGSSDPVESKMWELAEKALRGKGLKGKELDAALESFMAVESNLDKLRPMAEKALAAESDLLAGLE